MKNKLFIIFIFLFTSYTILSQDTIRSNKKVSDKNWKFRGIFGLNLNQAAFLNWVGGGSTSIAGSALTNLSCDYKKDKILWDNDLHVSFGTIFYFKDKEFEKTDDQIHLSSKFGYELSHRIKGMYYSAFFDFRTQFADGYNDDDNSIKISSFMSPGYLMMGTGIDYTPPGVKGLFFSLDPLSTKFTFVTKKEFYEKGAYGVKPGKNFRAEFGAYLSIKYEKEIAKNITLKTEWDFFTNYLEKPFKRIDLNGELLLSFKVNDWFSAFLQLNIIYDHDVEIFTDEKDKNGKIISGPRTQFRQLLGLGFNYVLKNYKENRKRKKK